MPGFEGFEYRIGRWVIGKDPDPARRVQWLAVRVDHPDPQRVHTPAEIDGVEARILRLREPCPMSSDVAWGRCCQVLAHVYGRDGDKAAFEMARTGSEGGLWAVLRKFANVPCAIRKARADLAPALPDLRIDLGDVLFVLAAFSRVAYPYSVPSAPCG